jgi:carbonic anhydrase/acetyltransferase-like protein (isoleucine patch superfamily)
MLGDENSITIGDGVTIGDRVMVHSTAEFQTVIGDRSVVGAGKIYTYI